MPNCTSTAIQGIASEFLRERRSGPHRADLDLIVAAFVDYMARQGNHVDADMYQEALASKLANPAFSRDLDDLLRVDAADIDPEAWADVVRERLIDAIRRRNANVP